jgi:hypothetical protein
MATNPITDRHLDIEIAAGWDEKGFAAVRHRGETSGWEDPAHRSRRKDKEKKARAAGEILPIAVGDVLIAEEKSTNGFVAYFQIRIVDCYEGEDEWRRRGAQIFAVVLSTSSSNHLQYIGHLRKLRVDTHWSRFSADFALSRLALADYVPVAL